MNVLQIAALALLALAGCATDKPTSAVADPTKLVAGKRFTGNTTPDVRCVGTGCYGGIEFNFDATDVSIRFLGDKTIEPGSLLLARGAVHRGVSSFAIEGGEIEFSDASNRKYKLWHDGTCLTGSAHTITNLHSSVRACPVR